MPGFGFRVSGSGLKGYHQPPEVNYWAVLTFGEIKQEVHAQVYHAGEIDVCENLDIVHFWWLVVEHLCESWKWLPKVNFPCWLRFSKVKRVTCDAAKTLYPFQQSVGGGDRIHPETARKSGRHGVQYAAHREGMCGTGAGGLAINYQSLLPVLQRCCERIASRVDHV